MLMVGACHWHCLRVSLSAWALAMYIVYYCNTYCTMADSQERENRKLWTEKRKGGEDRRGIGGGIGEKGIEGSQ